MNRENRAPRTWCVPLALGAVVLAGSLALSRPARADVDVRVDLDNAPAVPSFHFREEPHRVYDSTAGVYVVDDPDLGDIDAFEYGGSVWMFDDGFWYRSPSWEGDFEVVAPQDVPREVYDVPSYRWHHHPSYDSVHLRGWHPREWRDLRTENLEGRDNGWRNRDDYDRDVHYSDSQYRARVYGDTDVELHRHHHHHHAVHVSASVGIHRSHHHHHVDRVDRDDRRDRDDRYDRDDR